ncbi:helix-turn-helix transcriptional regulator [Kibdelosporangium aridum]|uniref:helix-turn-helix transcriptional regulator n=1 Tax=Kibdelosporangium aridum TaxID=2030 RepID=UPI0035F040B8
MLERLRQSGYKPDAASAGAVAETCSAVRADLLPARLRTRPPHFRAVAEAVAVAGHADPDILALLADVPESLVRTVLAGLRADGLLDGVEPERLRRTLFCDLPADVLRRQHARAARLLNDAGRPPVDIAPHLMALRTANEPWMRATLRAAARDTTDHPTAIRYLEHALAADPDDIATLVDYAHSISDRAPYLAHELLWTALDRATTVRDRAVLATELAWLAPATPRAASAAPVLGTALAELTGVLGPHPTGPDRDLHARSEAARLAAVWARPPAVLDAPVPAGDTRAERDLLALRSFSDMLAGRSAVTASDRARAALSESGSLGWQHALATFVLAMADEVDAAKSGFDRVLATAGDAGWTQALTRMLRALVLAEAGDVPAAVADAQTAVDAVENVDTARVVLATSLYRAGKTATAMRLLPDRDINVPVLGNPLALMLRASLAETDGDYAHALELSTRCGSMLAEMGVENPLIAPWWVNAARLHALAGDNRAAMAVADRYADVAERWGSASARGLALLAAGAVESDTEVMAEAVDLLAGTPAEWHCTHAELALGEALLRLEDRGGARRWFRSAADRATRCGYRGVAAHVRSRLIAAGGRVRQASDGRGGGNVLSGSERRIAALAAAGATNREIAARLRVTVRTVETHLTSVYRKLGVPGRMALRTDSEPKD